PLRKLERARSHRLALQAVHGLARVDDRTLARQVEEEVRVEALERERECVVVLHDDVADRRVVLGVRMFRLRVHRALEDVLDVGRLHLAAVVKVNAALEEEGVVPVVRRVPPLGEPRDELSVAVHLHERLLDVVEDDRRRRRGGRGRQVEPGRFGHGLHDQALRRLRRRPRIVSSFAMISRRLTRSPQPTLKTSPPTEAARAASRLASTTLSMYVKSRDWAPSPWTSSGFPRRPQRMNRGITAAYSDFG